MRFLLRAFEIIRDTKLNIGPIQTGGLGSLMLFLAFIILVLLAVFSPEALAALGDFLQAAQGGAEEPKALTPQAWIASLEPPSGP